MGRGYKFSFPLPGRRSTSNTSRDVDDTSAIPSVPSVPSNWSARVQESSQPSKAERLLGTSSLATRGSSKLQSVARSPMLNAPHSPGGMTVSVSEASCESDYTDMASSTAVEDMIVPSHWHTLHPRPSSNLLGANYKDGDGRSGSLASTASRRMHPQGSSSTLRSYYDAQKSPLSISQQTSASAVRDMALTKGHSPIVSENSRSTTSLATARDKQNMNNKPRRMKPARLDLSKLFPRPKANGEDSKGPLLSPNKLVDSPTAVSAISDYFPRYLSHDSPNSCAKSTKSRKEMDRSPAKLRKKKSKESPAPSKTTRRSIVDSSKVNVRRPPRGIQHWFDGLGDESDEASDDLEASIQSQMPLNPRSLIVAPVTRSSPAQLRHADIHTPSRTALLQPSNHRPRTDRKSSAHGFGFHHLNSPSQYSLQSHTSAQTKESKFSTSNLQDSSVLSISSSDEEDCEQHARKGHRVRDSLTNSTDNEGEIIIGEAQAFEVRPRPRNRLELDRPPSDSIMSMRSTSTNAATIEVMYSPDSSSHLSLPRHSRTWRPTHSRQPTAIPEDESRPHTSANSDSAPYNRPLSPSLVSNSVRSVKTSRSEPRSRSEQHKLMAVTEEEEALLEMMRRKRAAMAEHSFTEGYKTAIKQEQIHTHIRPQSPDVSSNTTPRTSAFLALESTSNILVENFPLSTSTHSLQKSNTSSPTSKVTPSTASGRLRKSQRSASKPGSTLRDESFDVNAIPEMRSRHADSPPTHPYHLSPALDFSPLDPSFPSPVRTSTPASINSPTTISHTSPNPSPVTPGSFRPNDSEVEVKVAGSEPSCNEDEDVTVSATGVVEPIANTVKVQSCSSKTSTRSRRRTASSGADVALISIGQQCSSTHNTREQCSDIARHQHGRNSRELRDLHSGDNSRTPRKPSSHRTSSISNSGTSVTGLRERPVRDSRISKTSRLSKDSGGKRESSVHTPNAMSARCSVSDDVLAAWGSLGGLRDWDRGRIAGA